MMDVKNREIPLLVFGMKPMCVGYGTIVYFMNTSMVNIYVRTYTHLSYTDLKSIPWFQ